MHEGENGRSWKNRASRPLGGGGGGDPQWANIWAT